MYSHQMMLRSIVWNHLEAQSQLLSELVDVVEKLNSMESMR